MLVVCLLLLGLLCSVLFVICCLKFVIRCLMFVANCLNDYVRDSSFFCC